MGASTLRARSSSSAPAVHSGADIKVRRHELDWLRTAAVFGLIPFHTAVIFTSGSFDYVKNAQTSALMDVLAAFVSIWGISLLFLVAGGASRYALASRSATQYLNERVMRLLIPFAFGMLVVVPLQIYIGRLAAATPAAPAPPAVAFYVGFLQTLLGVVTGHIPPGPEWIGHLWFIPPLMLFSALLVPFAQLAHSRRGTRAIGALAACRGACAPLALFGLPVAAVQFVTLVSGGLLPTSGAAVASNAIGALAYLIFFLYGYLLYTDERFIHSVRRDGWTALLLGMAAWLVIWLVVPHWSVTGALIYAQYAIVALARGYCAWWLVMGILGLGMRYLQFTTLAVDYLTRAAYPVYIIHMPILSLIALWVVRMDLGIWLKFGLIVAASFAASLAVYELLIRRAKPLRILFGLGAGRHSARPRGHTPQVTTTGAPQRGASALRIGRHDVR